MTNTDTNCDIQDGQLVRLNQFLARCGIGSRRGVEDHIVAGKVMVNDEVVSSLGFKVNPRIDQVRFEGKLVAPEEKKLFLFHKPVGVVSTLSDPQGRKCIADFIEDQLVRLVPVGRLDYDVGGLLLLTNDGQFCQKLLHPKYETPRRYIALVEYQPDSSLPEVLLKGVALEDGPAIADEASLVDWDEGLKIFPKDSLRGFNRKKNGFVCLTVSEGRNHFVKRFLGATGYPVLSLFRTSFGVYDLQGLEPGEMREISI